MGVEVERKKIAPQKKLQKWGGGGNQNLEYHKSDTGNKLNHMDSAAYQRIFQKKFSSIHRIWSAIFGLHFQTCNITLKMF